VLQGDAYRRCLRPRAELAEEKGLTFIHPFDDPDVIAGQGTIGMEILRQHPSRRCGVSCRSAAVV
jgi:threonine dehydratase